MPAAVYHDIEFATELAAAAPVGAMTQIGYAETAKIMTPVKHDLISHNSAFAHCLAFFNDDGKIFNLYFVNDGGNGDFCEKMYNEELSIPKSGFPNAKFSDSLPLWAEDTQMSRYDSPVAKSWVGDNFAQGSYSAFSLGLGGTLAETIHINGIACRKLFAPIGARIFFAGEHTSVLDENGTMEAAVESGERAAKLVASIKAAA